MKNRIASFCCCWENVMKLSRIKPIVCFLFLFISFYFIHTYTYIYREGNFTPGVRTTSQNLTHCTWADLLTGLDFQYELIWAILIPTAKCGSYT